MALRYPVLLSLVLLITTVTARAEAANPEPQASEVDAVFITGDCSIGNFSRPSCKHLWEKYFGSLKTLPVIGVTDTKQNGKLRWPVPAGKLEGYKAKVVVVSLGGSPMLMRGEQSESPEAAAEGVAACLKDVCARQPQATVLLLGLPVPPIPFFNDRTAGPAKQSFKDRVAKMKELTTELVAKLAAEGKRVRYIDPVPKLEARKKAIAEGVARVPDFHDVPDGWEGIAEAIAEPLNEILKAEKSR